MTIGLSGGKRMRIVLEDIQRKAGSGEFLRLGFLEGATYPNGTPVAYIAAINEFGRPDHNQPPRPFFRQMIAAKSPGWGQSMAKVLKAAGYDVDVSLARMGEGIRGQLQGSIRELTQPPLAPATVEAKGFDKPLIDTSVMINSVDYEVTKEG